MSLADLYNKDKKDTKVDKAGLTVIENVVTPPIEHAEGLSQVEAVKHVEQDVNPDVKFRDTYSTLKERIDLMEIMFQKAVSMNKNNHVELGKEIGELRASITQNVRDAKVVWAEIYTTLVKMWKSGPLRGKIDLLHGLMKISQ